MLYFVDRKKNIIRRAGENIAAAEVEATLQAHEAVAQVAVLAVPDEIREEEVMACVVAMAGAAPDRALAEELFEWCRARLAYFKAPGWVLFVDRHCRRRARRRCRRLRSSRGARIPARCRA